MSINNDQLKIWTNAPASEKIKNTHEQIRKALESSGSLSQRKYDPYLQGSYANSTNIKVDSDVDMVVELSSTFYPDLSALNDYQKSQFHETFPTSATYHWSDFRKDVVDALETRFGKDRIKSDGNKSVKLIGDENLLNADVVPCLEYRKYNSFDKFNTSDFVPGIKFWTLGERNEIINFPKVHKIKGEAKNHEARTDERYKSIVRIVKNIKRRLVEDYGFSPKIAPSYFIECAIYNVPDPHFNGDFQRSLEMVFNFLRRQCDSSRLITVSHEHLLFGDKLWQWNIPDAANFLQQSENYYLNN